MFAIQPPEIPRKYYTRDKMNSAMKTHGEISRDRNTTASSNHS
jgi:hypothetical protein